MDRGTHSTRRKAGVIATAVLIASLLMPSGALAQAGTAGETGAKVFDAMLLRPIGFFALMIGAVLFVPAAALTAASGEESISEAKDVFITPYAQNVFERKLGDF